MPSIQDVTDLGQAVWLDYIRRSFIESGELQAWIDRGVRGVTANPTILEKAIAGSNDYDQAIHRLVQEGKSVGDIYEALAFDDIGHAADLFRRVFDQTGGADGFVSLEVSPALAHDTDGTLAAVRHLFRRLDRPNVLIKIPATMEGIPAIETALSEGINVNITLMFSLAQYEAVAEAYLSALEKRVAAGQDISGIASVASFFVSRVDTQVDQALEKLGNTELQGTIAIANAKLVYARFTDIFSGERWEELKAKGARVQRPLWASTSTKNSHYPDTLYVDNLIGRDTVNTLPLPTLEAFLDHGHPAAAAETGWDEALDQVKRTVELGVDLDAITSKLVDDGVAKFAKSWDALMASIADKRERLLSGWKQRVADLGPCRAAVDAAVHEMIDHRIAARIWAHDYTVWKRQPTEISNRLGWLHTAEIMAENLQPLEALTDAVRAAGYTHALLLGMGGSSLAPEVFRKTFGVREGYLDLAVLDSTVPASVLTHAKALDPAKTLFIVSTKSGTTTETLAFFKYFYNWTADALGSDRAGEHFVAVTDPGSKVAELAARHKFRAVFLNDPDIGGRYSALSHFGLVPAALVGVDIPRLLDEALTAACSAESCVPVEDNPGLWLGAVLGECAKAGRDKATLVTSPSIASFGDWVEQLIAESTGKEGRGILPVVGEPLGAPEVYGDDRAFTLVQLSDDATHDVALEALAKAGQPVVRLRLRDKYSLGGDFFLWEMAVAVAGQRLGINPFDQPNVESAKVRAREMLAQYRKAGELPAEAPALTAGRIAVYGNVKAGTPAEGLATFLNGPEPGAYIALQAYVQPTPESDGALQALRIRLRDRYRLATTVGYGPRFLHSTGQLHKGDAGRGLFVQFTADDFEDVPIPDEAGAAASAVTFGVLTAAEAMGDRKALLDAGRRVIRLHLGAEVVAAINSLAEHFAEVPA